MFALLGADGASFTHLEYCRMIGFDPNLSQYLYYFNSDRTVVVFAMR